METKDQKIKRLTMELEELQKDKEIEQLEAKIKSLKLGGVERRGIFPNPRGPYDPYKLPTYPNQDIFYFGPPRWTVEELMN